MPGVVGGFEPADILLALCLMAEQLRDKAPAVVNAYPRAGRHGQSQGARPAGAVFQPADALWRGLARIPQSGLALRPEYADLDAMARLDLRLPEVASLPGCRCGDVLKGALPPACPLFGKNALRPRPWDPAWFPPRAVARPTSNIRALIDGRLSLAGCGQRRRASQRLVAQCFLRHFASLCWNAWMTRKPCWMVCAAPWP